MCNMFCGKRWNNMNNEKNSLILVVATIVMVLVCLDEEVDSDEDDILCLNVII